MIVTLSGPTPVVMTAPSKTTTPASPIDQIPKLVVTPPTLPKVIQPEPFRELVQVVPLVGPQGPAFGFAHHQVEPSAEWYVSHNLGLPREPTILLDELYGDPNQPVWSDVTHLDLNSLLITLPQPVTGWAYL